MVISDLTYEERRRFKKASVCPICNGFIEDYDSFEMVKNKFGRYMTYTFLHTNCIYKFHEKVLHESMVVNNQEV